MSYRDNIFTVYDLMEKKGYFRSNPANRDAVDKDTRQSIYKGPVQYPKMLYSPKGEYRISQPAEIIATPMGPQRVGEQRELINKIVESEAEEAVLKALGWLDHPAKSIHAGGGEAPPVSSEESIKSLEQQVKDLMAELAAAQASVTVDQSHSAEAYRALEALTKGNSLAPAKATVPAPGA